MLCLICSEIVPPPLRQLEAALRQPCGRGLDVEIVRGNAVFECGQFGVTNNAHHSGSGGERDVSRLAFEPMRLRAREVAGKPGSGGTKSEPTAQPASARAKEPQKDRRANPDHQNPARASSPDGAAKPNSRRPVIVRHRRSTRGLGLRDAAARAANRTPAAALPRPCGALRGVRRPSPNSVIATTRSEKIKSPRGE